MSALPLVGVTCAGFLTDDPLHVIFGAGRGAAWLEGVRVTFPLYSKQKVMQADA